MSSHASSSSERSLPVLLVLFVGSGCAALIYEVVWFELLRQVIGASSISLAIVLSSYMGGLFLGSWGFPRWISRAHHPLKIYAVLEFGIGVIGLVLLVALPLVRLVYLSAVGYGPAGILLRAFVCLLCLLPPTILMGATLPAVARWMSVTRVGISRVGFLYTANIVGAVFGTLLAGFYLLPIHDMFVASAVAATVNFLVALVALGLARRTARAQPDEPVLEATGPGHAIAVDRRLVHVIIGISGLTALGAQVVWTRLMSLLFGASVYTFTIILAVFLLGLSIGSSVGAYLSRRTMRPDVGLAWSQLGLVLAIPFCAYMIIEVLPFWVLDREAYVQLVPRFTHDLLRAVAALLPATVLWGISFPLALAAAGRGEDEPGRLVGGLYAANTLGAIIGAMVFGMALIPLLGTERSQQLLTLLAGLAAIVLLAAVLRRGDAAAPMFSARRVAASGLALLGLTGWIVTTATPIDPRLVAYGQELAKWDWSREYEFVGEGRVASVAVSRWADEFGTRNFHVAGKIVASDHPQDMRLQRMLGHLPGLFHPNPKSVLIVGFGAGVTAGSFVRYPGIERIVICEIEPLVPLVAGKYFAAENNDVLNDPRTEIIYDDARHFIATTDETFDIITSDPIHPWVKGSAALYSSEYFELVKSRLNPGGLVTQWVPLYQSSEEVVKTQIATFVKAFPQATVWNPDDITDGYDLVILGQRGPLRIDVAGVLDRLGRLRQVQSSLLEVGFLTLADLLSTYISSGTDLEPWLKGAEINRDRSLRLQYMAGLTVDRYEAPAVYQALLPYRRYPQEIFIVPAGAEDLLRRTFEDAVPAVQ